MKKLFCCLLVVLFILPIMSATSSSSADDTEHMTLNGVDYVRTFYDEFEGKTLDTTKWELCPEWSRADGACSWNDDMTSLDGKGNLLLGIEYDNDVIYCGAVRTRNTFLQKYGYFEIKCKLQEKKGFWSAFWMMPEAIDNGTDGGADGTEIDIFEAFSITESKINHAIHYDGYESRHKSISKAVVADVYDGEYHTFGMDWSPNGYFFYIDGVLSYYILNTDIDICEVREYMIISIETGSWTGKPNKNDVPDYLTVDYVKAFQRYNYSGITVPTTTKTPIFKGDLEDDDIINMHDLLLMRMYLAGTVSAISKNTADINSDGVIDTKDCLLLRKYIAGIINSF